jgi:two-component system repressor protein LuxO
MMSKPILLVEDTSSLRMIYEAILERNGYSVVSASDGEAGRAAFIKHSPSVVLLDLILPDVNGLDLMEELLNYNPDTQFVVITAHGSVNRAVEAMRAGAFEFLVKPFDETRLVNAISNALASKLSAAGAERQFKDDIGTYHDFIGGSNQMQSVYRTIERVSGSMATVFISGESGTGKDMCAQAVHDASSRGDGPFVVLNCGAIRTDLLESEVFGHLQGSFSGAISDKIGAAQAADGGTLFLDEICEMDLNLQSKLMRFLQSSTIQALGAAQSKKINVRIICATNRDPLEQVRLGRFREDLFYRLHVVPITMPPLRERGSDVIDIAKAKIEVLAAEEGRNFRGFNADVEKFFQTHPWPGNVRQLINVLRNVVVLHDADVVSASMLPVDLLQAHHFETKQGTAEVGAGSEFDDLLFGKTLAEIERVVIEKTIDKMGGSVTKAARILDVSPSTLYRKREVWNKPEALHP